MVREIKRKDRIMGKVIDGVRGCYRVYEKVYDVSDVPDEDSSLRPLG